MVTVTQICHPAHWRARPKTHVSWTFYWPGSFFHSVLCRSGDCTAARTIPNFCRDVKCSQIFVLLVYTWFQNLPAGVTVIVLNQSHTDMLRCCSTIGRTPRHLSPIPIPVPLMPPADSLLIYNSMSLPYWESLSPFHAGGGVAQYRHGVVPPQRAQHQALPVRVFPHQLPNPEDVHERVVVGLGTWIMDRQGWVDSRYIKYRGPRFVRIRVLSPDPPLSVLSRSRLSQVISWNGAALAGLSRPPANNEQTRVSSEYMLLWEI